MTSTIEQTVPAAVRAAVLPESVGATDPGQAIITHDRPRREDTTMLACVWDGKNRVSMRDDVPRPCVIEPTDALVRVTATTICGSDLHLLHKALPGLQRGDVLGHEFAGVVVDAGARVSELGGPRVGERVVCSFCLSCGGQCASCARGATSQCLCTNPSADQEALHGHAVSGLFGYSHLTGAYSGGQAEYVRVPFAHCNCLPIPDELPDEKALYLSDVLPTSYHAVVDLIKATGGNEFDGVGGAWGVWGAGPIGILAAKFAFLVGKAERVIVVDFDAFRLEHVRNKIPGVETVNLNAVKSVPLAIKHMLAAPKKKGPQPSPELSAYEEVDEMTLKGAGLDYAIDAAGGEYARAWLDGLLLKLNLATDTSETMEECMRSVKPFGAVGVIAVYIWKAHFFPVGTLMENGIRLVGNGQAPVHKYWKHLLQNMLVPGKVDPLDLIVTHRFRLEDTARAYKLMDKHKHGLIKAFIETPFAADRAKMKGKEGEKDDKVPPLTPLV